MLTERQEPRHCRQTQNLSNERLTDDDQGLTCLKCDRVASPEFCSYVVTCGPHEICRGEQVVTYSGYVKYYLGCGSTQTCGGMNPIGRRRTYTEGRTDKRASGDLTICSQCCTGQLCNAQTCNSKGYLTDAGPICFNCIESNGPDTCSEIVQCSAGEVCSLEVVPTAFETLYKTSCKRIQECHGNSGGCPGCCTSDLCNACNSSEMAKAIAKTTPLPTSSTAPDHCVTNPCVFGRCVSTPSTFQCVCIPGFVGGRCDQVLSPTTIAKTTPTATTSHAHNHCTSNPCLHGQCVSRSNTFQCMCTPGFTGVRCDQDHLTNTCLHQHCKHGVCHSVGDRAVCHCDAGFSGQHCDQATVTTGTQHGIIWSSWTTCDVSCGAGKQLRVRLCEVSGPINNCAGDAVTTETRPCALQPCAT